MVNVGNSFFNPLDLKKSHAGGDEFPYSSAQNVKFYEVQNGPPLLRAALVLNIVNQCANMQLRKITSEIRNINTNELIMIREHSSANIA